MKRVVFIVFSLVAANIASSDSEPSDRLLNAALADHFARYFCGCRFPYMKSDIQRAFDGSRLRNVSVPCTGLTCVDKEHSLGMQTLWDKAKQMPEAEALDTCSSYPDTLKEIEKEFDDELGALYPRMHR